MDEEQPPRPELPPPGWFPDPFDANAWRWWDGHAWSPHSSPRSETPRPTAAVALRGMPPELAAEIRSARFARIGVVVWAVVLIVVATTVYRTFPTWPQLVHDFRSSTQSSNTVVSAQESGWSALDVFNIPAGVFFLVWQYRSAVVARALGYPTHRTPGWGVALWFIPIVNFWMPYQALRDLLPPGNRARRKMLLLWLVYVISEPLGVLAIFREVRPAVIAFDIVAALLFVAIGSRLVATITEQHRLDVHPTS